MVFAIRRLLLRSNQRLPNLNLSVRSSANQLRCSFASISTTNTTFCSTPQLLRTPSCLQQSRQFSSSQRRKEDGKKEEGDVVGTKSEEDFEKELETRAEESSKKEDVGAVKEVENPLEEEMEVAKEAEETSSKEAEPEAVPQSEKDSAVFEDVELPVKDKDAVESPAEDAIEAESAILEDAELPTKVESPAEDASEAESAILEDAELPAKVEPPTEDAIEAESAILEDAELPAKEDAVSDPIESVSNPINERTITTEEASTPEDVETPVETKSTLIETAEETAKRKKSSPKNKSVAAAKSAREAASARNKTPQASAATEEEPSTDTSVQLPITSKTGEIIPQEKMLDINKFGREYFNADDVDDNFEINSEGFKLISDWMKDIGLTLEKLGYYLETYPGIDTEMIEAVESGRMTEEAMFELLEEILEAEVKELPPEAQEKLTIFAKTFVDVSEHLHDDPNKTPEYTDLELKQLGLRRSDIEALANDTAELTAPQTIRIGRALKRAGLDEEEYKALIDDEELKQQQRELEKQYGVEDAPDEEIPTSEPSIEVYKQVGKEVDEMQARTGMSDDRITYYYEKFEGNVSAELIEAVENKKITEERMLYYVEKYGGEYPLPMDSELIIAMDKGEIEEAAFAHVVESFATSPSPNLVKAALKGDIDPEQINRNAATYDVDVHVIGSVVAGDITEAQLREFAEAYPGVSPDVQLIKDIDNGLYKGQLDRLRALGEMYPSVMTADLFRGLLDGEFTEEEISKAEHKAEEEDPWDIPEDAMKAWQEEYGISDKMIAFLRDAYPGIWPDLVTSYAKGEIKEAEIPKYIDSEEPWLMPQGMLDRWLQDNEIPEARMMELREKFPKIWPDLLADVVHGEVKEADVEKIIAESEAEEEAAKQENPWLAAGIDENNLEEWQNDNSVTDDMLEYLLEAYPDITPDITADFAEGLIEQKDIPDAIKKYHQKRGKEVQPETEERQAELQKARQKLSEAVRESKEEEKQAEEAQLQGILASVSKGDQPIQARSKQASLVKPQEVETSSDIKGETTAERIAWYEKRFPGINIEQISLAEMGVYSDADLPALIRNDAPSQLDQDMMRKEMLKMTPTQLKDFGRTMITAMANSTDLNATVSPEPQADEEPFKIDPNNLPEEWQKRIDDMRAKAKLPGAKGLPTPANGGTFTELRSLSVEEYYERMLADGIDPLTMSEQEVFRLLEKKFSAPDFKHTDADGNTVKYTTPKTKEELDQIRADAGSPMETIDWAAELASVPKHPEQYEAQKDIEEGLDKFLGTLSKDEINENKKEFIEEGFFNYGEENPKEVGEDEEFQGDDITSQGHDELEQHRELREYARLAAWELPLLHKLAKPFEPPKQNQPLRFRYTTYFGAQHPADKKVVVEFAPNDIPDLTDVQRMKMIKLAGVRYNPSTGLIKIASESMETQAQNKRYLGDLVTKLIKESKDPKDTFEDVPADFRHHKPKAFHKLPEGWKMTPERKKELEEKKRKALEANTGKLVDGNAAITEALRRLGMAQLQQSRIAAAAGQRGAVMAGRAGRPVVRGKVGQSLPGRVTK
ncbi:mitochondrial ribosomal small subunit component protein [Venturia nashicola]|uniref:Mitochondrial ribosomal small subunit component protein n=1 Tax=Venturia nashicola TaxID=86259 RepID=A0A4Z1P420_9PEZI|nr:mitochondrial ribosomal small subunit component protein [Venturia nashicola]TLD24563.1 mitochondrial ribosomal small subunit component protein [Venturia nashicola]